MLQELKSWKVDILALVLVIVLLAGCTGKKGLQGAGQMKILRSNMTKFGWENDSGEIVVEGVVKNTGTVGIAYGSVDVRLLDENGSVLEESSADASNLNQGAKRNFSIKFNIFEKETYKNVDDYDNRTIVYSTKPMQRALDRELEKKIKNETGVETNLTG